MRKRVECDKLDVFYSVTSILGMNSSRYPYTIPLLEVKSVCGKRTLLGVSHLDTYFS